MFRAKIARLRNSAASYANEEQKRNREITQGMMIYGGLKERRNPKTKTQHKNEGVFSHNALPADELAWHRKSVYEKEINQHQIL